MPLDVFDGEPSQELHEHYDPDGNLTGSTVVTRPGWSDDARAWALGLSLREANQCPRGHDLTESTDPDFAWSALPPVICFACLAAENAAKAHENDKRHRAMLHPLKKVPRPKRAKRGR